MANLLSSSSLRSLQSGAPLQSLFMSIHSPLEHWNWNSFSSLEATCVKLAQSKDLMRQKGHYFSYVGVFFIHFAHLQTTATACSGRQRAFWSRLHSLRQVSEPLHLRLAIGTLLSLPAPFTTLTTWSTKTFRLIPEISCPLKHHINIYLFCSKVIARMLADQVGLIHAKVVATQTPPRAVHIHLHDLPSPGLIDWWHSVNFGCNLLLTFPPLLSLRPSIIFSLFLLKLPQVSLFTLHFRSPSLWEMFNLW